MTVLVTGARGAIARNVIAQLLEAGAPVRAASREPSGTDLPGGVEPVRFDFTAPETLAPALKGVDKVFLYAASDGIDAFLAAAKDAGVQRLVLLSSAAAHGPDGDENEIGRRHLDAERPIAASGIPWTFVRPAMFATNSLWWAQSIRDEGVVRLPYPEAPVNPIHERDIAEVAYAALTEDGHEGRAHLIDGPGHLTQRRQVELIGEALGRDIAVAELPRAVAANFLPESLLDMLAAGIAHRYGPTAEAVTGRPARTYEQWVADHVADFK
ncbi:SDR family oxidoreductase [Glycomyces harbinensis]|uniref:Uncharacterized conserved protein YbjT, contains NAD(P)-binding and DUF2867 domains n=1 Tax=Glycomyces harbinensis TaxID=58114 RepID=A0A1G7C129_9ACTN|nr:NAD(P)H-binding protein [Glycomyces harbinensis]SDE32145.1 Uncharacterized conserved protein YbjT, contains NAD(P)-binding and DUF2867 domains [Glycomyces harbinensis]